MRRVAITGLGIISSCGNKPDAVFSNVMAAKSGIRRMTHPFAEKLSIRIAAEAEFKVSDYFSTRMSSFDRTSLIALAAAMDGWKDSGLELNESELERAGVYMGTGMGGSQSVDENSQQLFGEKKDRINPLTVVKIMSNAAASHISINYKLKGPCLTYTTACSSSSIAIGEAFRAIKCGYSDVILAGGSECLITFGSFKSWESLGVLAFEDPEDASASSKPFSKDRTGFVLGEGAAILVLEEMERAKKRGAKIYAELVGYGSTADANHITAPTVDGQARAMQLALQEAGLGIDDIDYINAHGTATATNDVTETQAIKKVFGDLAYKIPVSSTKSMHGHLIGAAGAVEFLISVLAIANRGIPPTANLKNPDPECDLDYVPNVGRTGQELRAVMSNSFGFGGTNGALIAKKV
jgi:beta-ketoacyl-acyl-carrier-protein synthase II